MSLVIDQWWPKTHLWWISWCKRCKDFSYRGEGGAILVTGLGVQKVLLS